MTMIAQAFTARPAVAPGAAWAAWAPRMAAPARSRHRRVRLTAGPAAVAYASGHAIAAIAEWRVPVDRSLASILTSDLIINAVTNGAEETLMLAIRCTPARFRVEVHDASAQGDSREAAEPGADAGRGLLLAAALAAESGYYRTPVGRAVYYALEFAPGTAETGDGRAARGAASGDGEP